MQFTKEIELKTCLFDWLVAEHAFHPIPQEAEAGESLGEP